MSTKDKLCRRKVGTIPNLLVPWYLMACYAYYVEDDPILSDDCYDWLCKELSVRWETIDHFHKSYLNQDAVNAGTFLGNYPSRVKGAVNYVRKING